MIRNLIVFHVLNWLHLKLPSGARFIVAGKKCINKQPSKHVTSAFKLRYSQVEAYYKKNIILVGPKPLIQDNSFPLEYINKINKKMLKNTYIRFFYTKYKDTQWKLLDILYKVIDFVFKVGTRDYIAINQQGFASRLSIKFLL